MIQYELWPSLKSHTVHHWTVCQNYMSLSKRTQLTPPVWLQVLWHIQCWWLVFYVLTVTVTSAGLYYPDNVCLHPQAWCWAVETTRCYKKKKYWSFTVKFEQVSHVYDKRENMDRVWNHQVAFIKSVLRINHMPIRTSEVLSVSINVPAGCLRKWFSGIGAGWHLQSSFCAEVQPKLIRGFSSGT